MKAKWLPNLAIESGQGPTLLRCRALGIDLLPVGTHLHPHISASDGACAVLPFDHGIVCVLVRGDRSVAIDAHLQIGKLLALEVVVFSVGHQLESFRLCVPLTFTVAA